MNACQSVHDVIPLKDLQRISILQERAAELEHKAAVILSDAQDLRVKADDIVEGYRYQIKQRGWEACRAEAERANAISWYYDPLPGQGARV
ncbi:MAG: hypothetical protein KBA49_06255 [Methanolinea sp.]|nr:hypothetical protein [Methanolinea sp.]